MLMCKDATHLMSMKRDRPLTTRERISLRFHLTMCSACRECDRQFELLHHVNRRFEPPPENRGGDAPRH